MGERAVLRTEDNRIGMYIHSFGLKEDVERLLDVCRRNGAPSPEEDASGWAALCLALAAQYGYSGLGRGIDGMKWCIPDFLNHGWYTIKNWEIAEHLQEVPKKYTEKCESDDDYEWADGSDYRKLTEKGWEWLYGKRKCDRPIKEYSIALTISDGIYVFLDTDKVVLDALLCYCKERRYREPKKDCYGTADFVAVAAAFLGVEKVAVGDGEDGLSAGKYYDITGWKRARSRIGTKMKERILRLQEPIDTAFRKSWVVWGF